MWRRRAHLRSPFLAGLILVVSLFGPTDARSLLNSASPYLKSHANDPIKWRPWGREAREIAANEDKLIFLSIGYLSCHWCHKLARDTFSKTRVIERLNKHFIPVLVDREERPDLDSYYMEIMQGMTGASGWPANFVLTADGTPLYAIGYVTPDPSNGSPGLLAILDSLVTQWTDNRTELLKDLDITRTQLKAFFAPTPTGVTSNLNGIRDAATQLWASVFDEDYGGFGPSTKFPLPNVLSFLLDEGVRNGDVNLLDKIYKTLDHMAAGGIRDQLGGAFHRYAVDRFWQLPHFEIMLDDNALLAQVYLKAYQASKTLLYAQIARDILEEMVRRFQLADGGFATALDSDSEGREGKFYTWSANDVRAALAPRSADAFLKAFVDTQHGLIENRSVIRIVEGPRKQQAVREQFARDLEQMRIARAKRVHPQRDDKILISWNALTVSAFAKAAQVLKDKRYKTIARTTLAHLLKLAGSADELRHSYHQRQASDAVFLDDYAFLIESLIDVYETEFDVTYLEHARTFADVMVKKFQGKENQPFYFSPKELSSNIPRRVLLNEDGKPSGNSAALRALHRLALFGNVPKLAMRAQSIVSGLGHYLEKSAASATGLLSALHFRSENAYEIVIVGARDDPGTRHLLHEAYKRPLRGTVVGVIPPNAPSKNEAWPLLAGRPLLDTQPTAYVCRKRLCDLPVDTTEALAQRLERLISPSTEQ